MIFGMLLAAGCWTAAHAALSSTPPSYWSSAAASSTTPPRFLDAIRAEPWRGGVEPAEEVYPAVPLTVTQGEIPAALRGTLFRNGPGRIRIGEAQYGHWFDGDGYVVSVSLDGSQGTAMLTARYVDTPRARAQRRHDGPGLATRGAWSPRADGSLLANLFRIPTNPANTNVITDSTVGVTWNGNVYGQKLKALSHSNDIVILRLVSRQQLHSQLPE